jgi:hypothetical protein
MSKARPFRNLPEGFKDLLLNNLVFKHVSSPDGLYDTKFRDITGSLYLPNLHAQQAYRLRLPYAPEIYADIPIETIYQVLVPYADNNSTARENSFMWKYGDRVYVRLVLKPLYWTNPPSLDIQINIYNEQRAREEARSSNDGLFYSMTRGSSTGEWVTFPTRKSVVTIQKLYRGKLGRRRADQAREEYYRPGGRGYLAARNNFAAQAAAQAAARRL